MKKKPAVPIIVGIVLLLIIGVVYLIFRLNAQRQYAGQEVFVEQGDVDARFLNNDLDTAPDAAVQGRVIRGYIDRTDFTSTDNNPNGYIVASVQLNWPAEEPQRTIPFELMPNSEFLCWGNDFVAQDGTTTPIKDTIFLLDDLHKLEIAGQKGLTREEALQKLQRGTPVVLALSEQYVGTSINKVFQVAIVGCQ